MPQVTGKAASFFVIGASIGELAIPATIGALLIETDYMALIYGMIIFSALQLVALVALWLKGSSKPRIREDEVEMQDVQDIVAKSHNLGLAIHEQAHINAPIEADETRLDDAIVDEDGDEEAPKKKVSTPPAAAKAEPQHHYVHEPLEALHASPPWLRHYKKPFSVGFAKLHEEGIPFTLDNSRDNSPATTPAISERSSGDEQ
jgi:hypothetical protein